MIILLGFYISGRGIGASGAIADVIYYLQAQLVPSSIVDNPYLTSYSANGRTPMMNYLLPFVGGIMLGSFISALLRKDVGWRVVRGPNSSINLRLSLALAGGMLVGFGTRLSRGCSSGLALVGGAQMSVGAFVFMFAAFAGGFAFAYFVRRQWL